MIEVLSNVEDKETGYITITVGLPHPRDGFLRYHPQDVEEELNKLGVKRGKIVNPTVLCNKPGHPLKYELFYSPIAEKKVSQNTKENVDKKPESVIIKKTSTRKRKTGG